jgi:tRNA U34 5-methylaminomethyl-2-thiouridine-forming methyltransferase MnmC
MRAGERNLIITDDGSHSIQVEDMNVCYHSKHGAIQESKHVFIKAGLHEALQTFPHQRLNILEVGFGTGLNAFLTAIETKENSAPIRYWGIEAFPLEMSTAVALNYPDQLGNEDLFNAIQLAPWSVQVPVHEQFILLKHAEDILSFDCKDRYHLIYFDAFSPEAQPELWTEDVFRKLFECTLTRGMLVTYCSKSAIRRSMQAAGWKVEKIQGPWGKREMVRAKKP